MTYNRREPDWLVRNVGDRKKHTPQRSESIHLLKTPSTARFEKSNDTRNLLGRETSTPAEAG